MNRMDLDLYGTPFCIKMPDVEYHQLLYVAFAFNMLIWDKR